MNVPSTPSRLWARLIDQMIMVLFMLPAFRGITATADGYFVPWALFAYLVAVPLAYETLAVWLFGTTAGKWVFNLRVIEKKIPGRTPSGWAAFLRASTSFFSLFFGYGIYAPMWLRPERTHVADWVSGTRVVGTHRRARPVHSRVVFGFFITGLLGLCGWLTAAAFWGGLTTSLAGLHF